MTTITRRAVLGIVALAVVAAVPSAALSSPSAELATAQLETPDEYALWMRLAAGGKWRRLSMAEKIEDLSLSRERVSQLVVASARWQAARRADLNVPSILTVPEVADIFRVSRKTVFGWQRSGKLPAIRTPGRGIRFKREHIEALLSAGETA